MNKLTKVLLSVPLLLTTVACGDVTAADRIVTGPHPLGGNVELTVNCTQNLILEDETYVSRDEYPGFEQAHDLMVKEICS